MSLKDFFKAAKKGICLYVVLCGILFAVACQEKTVDNKTDEVIGASKRTQSETRPEEPHTTPSAERHEHTFDSVRSDDKIIVENQKTITAQSDTSESVSKIEEVPVETPEPMQEERPLPEQETETQTESAADTEEMPTPADQLEEQPQTCIGSYTVTWYCPCPECCGGNIGALGVELTPGYSVAMPDASLLGRTVLVEGFGYYCVQDISPGGICDIFIGHHSEIPSCGMVESVEVYLVE